MPLTKTEYEFLDAYVFEATSPPFGGPATDDLRRRGIHYSDLNWILTAYDRELCSQGIHPLGKQNPNPPSSPWTELADAKLRNAELRQELECQLAEPENRESAMTTAPGPPQNIAMAGDKR